MGTVSVRVGVYALLVAVAAGGVFVATWAGDRHALGEAPRFVTVLLLVAAVIAQRFPIDLSEKTKVYVDAAIFTAAALMLEAPVAMLVASVAVGIDELILRSSWRQALFNVAQTALYVGAGALTFEWLHSFAVPPTLPGLGSALAVLAAAAVMHLLNTALVAGVVAVQLRRDAYRTWREGLLLDLPQHLTLVAIGVLLAVVAGDYPWLAPLFAAPLAFVYLSLRRTLQLRKATRSTLLAAVDLAELLNQREPPGHSRRVARRARQLAERLGLEPDQIENVESAARFHHLGELADRASAIASRVGDDAENIPIEPSEPLTAVPAYAGGAGANRHLGERWDGSGVPDRLAGEAIPLASRLIAVVDEFDRLVSDPDSRCRADIECALAILRGGAGRDWDPRLVEEMVALARGGLVDADPESVSSRPKQLRASAVAG